MKNFILKLLCVAIFVLAIKVQAQATFSGSKKDYTQSMDSILTYVDKTPIRTGILYDRVMSFSDLDWLKETAIPTISNYQHFIQSWSELHRASYNPRFISVENLQANINANTNPDLIDIGIINTEMNYIDFGTPSNPSLIDDGGFLQNVAGINPFLEKLVTVIAPLKERVYTPNVSFRLLPSFMLQESGLKIKTLAANFGTATDYELISNYVVNNAVPNITYTTSGKKDLQFTVTFSDGSTEIVIATIEVVFSTAAGGNTLASPMSFPSEQDFVGTAGITAATTGNIAFQGYNESVATKGVLEYRTYYNTVTNPGYSATTSSFSAPAKINKPLIILDGYDPGDGRKIYQGSNGYDPKKLSLYQLMSYVDSENTVVELVEKLRKAPYGYDVTLVNFPNGADYIERNAMALVALLTRENAKLTTNSSTEQVAIMGPSMGGLVARYALAHMEKNNIIHNTKLWVSFDSPHLGANIPIAAQENLYFFGYRGRKEQAKQKFDENFRSPAARQMLIEQLDAIHQAFPYPNSLWSSAFNGQNNNTPFRQQFQTNQNLNGVSGSNGYPQNLRKIAIINGAVNGSKTNSEGQLFLDLQAFKIIKYGQIFGTPIQTKIRVAAINDRFLGVPFATTTTFSGRVTFFLQLNNFPYVLDGSITRINANPRGSMDNVPGGMFDTQGIIQKEFNISLEQDLTGRRSIEWRTIVNNHSFIPTVSALGFKNPNFNWSNSLNRNLVCDPLSKEIYFDSYFAPKSNENHVFVSAENAKWLLEELAGNPQAPHFPFNENDFTGPNAVCTTATFSFPDLCKLPSAVSWSYSGNLQLVSQTATSITLNKVGDGAGFIKATFQNGQSITKNVWVGVPIYNNFEPIGNQSGYNPLEPNLSYGTGEGGCNAIRFKVNFDSPAILEYQWEKLSNSQFNLPTSSPTGDMTFTPQCNEQLTFRVRTRNICGWSEWKTFEMSLNRCTMSCESQIPPTLVGANFMLNPNPVTNGLLNVTVRYTSPWFSYVLPGGLTDSDGNPTRGLVQRIRVNITVVNNLGQTVLTINNSPMPAQLNLSNLTPGLYVVNFEHQSNVESHNIIVN